MVYLKNGKSSEAEALFKESVTKSRALLGSDNPIFKDLFEDYVTF